MMPVFDTLLALGAVVCAALALVVRDRTASIAAFMVMGFLVALAWVRLGAPDVALAEAAIGAGLTGALLLRSAGRIGPVTRRTPPALVNAGSAVLASGLAMGLVWAFASTSGGLIYPPLVAAQIEASGVSNPVTAVLLNFRVWDTLLEIVVLVVALMLVAVLAPRRIVVAPLGQMMLPFARIIVPLSVLLAGHLLWLGASAPGGAFQAAAVLAGGMLVLVLGGYVPFGARAVRLATLGGLAGLAVFLIAALASGAQTGLFLGYPVEAAKTWILVIESALTLSIAAMLVLLFVGSNPRAAQ